MNKIKMANESDLFRVTQFMSLAGQAVEDDDIFSGNFILLEDEEGSLQGVIGLEIHDTIGMLRSFTFSSEVKEQVPVLFHHVLQLAEDRGLSQLFLASNKPGALDFFEALDFEKREAEQLPQSIRYTPLVEKVSLMPHHYFMEKRYS